MLIERIIIINRLNIFATSLPEIGEIFNPSFDNFQAQYRKK